MKVVESALRPVGRAGGLVVRRFSPSLGGHSGRRGAEAWCGGLCWAAVEGGGVLHVQMW